MQLPGVQKLTYNPSESFWSGWAADLSESQLVMPQPYMIVHADALAAVVFDVRQPATVRAVYVPEYSSAETQVDYEKLRFMSKLLGIKGFSALQRPLIKKGAALPTIPLYIDRARALVLYNDALELARGRS